MPASLIGAGIGAVGSIAGGASGKKGANNAAATQAAAYDRATQAQQQQYQQTRADLQPYTTAGTGALAAQQGLLGLNGNDAQAQAIAALKASPAFTSLYDTGADTILQNAAATGGLRGGNTQNSLAQFGSSLLAQVIQNQLGNLGGLTSLGANAAAGVGNAGQGSANAISNLAVQQGNSAAGGQIANATIGNNTLNSLTNFAQSFLNRGGGITAQTTQNLQPAAQSLIGGAFF